MRSSSRLQLCSAPLNVALERAAELGSKINNISCAPSDEDVSSVVAGPGRAERMDPHPLSSSDHRSRPGPGATCERTSMDHRRRGRRRRRRRRRRRHRFRLRPIKWGRRKWALATRATSVPVPLAAQAARASNKWPPVGLGLENGNGWGRSLAQNRPRRERAVDKSLSSSVCFERARPGGGGGGATRKRAAEGNHLGRRRGRLSAALLQINSNPSLVSARRPPSAAPAPSRAPAGRPAGQPATT